MIHAPELKAGMRLSDALELTIKPELLARPDIVILNHGVEILDPENYYLHDDDRIIVGILPHGGGGGDNEGKSIGQIVIGLVLIVVGVFVDAPNLIVMGAGMVLGGAAGLLIKPPTVATQTPQNSDRDTMSFGITGQSNAPRPYQACMRIYGQYKVFPAIAANPIITNVGTQSVIAAIYDFGIGNISVTDIRVGDTPVGQFSPELRLHTNVIDIQPELCNLKVAYDQFSFVLQNEQPLTLVTNPDTWLAELTLLFTQGLVQFDAQGNPRAAAAGFVVRWREVGSGTWTDVRPESVFGMSTRFRGNPLGYAFTYFKDEGYITYSTSFDSETGLTSERDDFTWRGNWMGFSAPDDGLSFDQEVFGYQPPIVLTRGELIGENTYELIIGTAVMEWDIVEGFAIEEMSTRPKAAAVRLQFPRAGQYEIEITRKTPISADTKLFDSVTLTMLKSYVTGPMFNLRTPHTMLEMRLLASEKVSGVIQNLSAVALSVLPAFDVSGNYLGDFATRNPAWCALDVLIGSATPKPVPHSLIDWPSWFALAEFCDTQRTWNIDGIEVSAPRHTCDVIIDFVAPIKEIVESILSCCRASLVFTQTGKYGVLIDQQNDIPRQLITPSNSWDFAGTRTYTDEVHALRMSFIDRDREYQRQEIIVYRDGYNVSNATRFEEMGTAGITEWFRAWAYGRYMMAQVLIRSELFTLKMDIEHLAVQRGDKVLVQHDVPRTGGYSSRIVEVVGNNVSISQDVSTAPSAYCVRLQNGSIRQGAVTASVDSNTFTLDDASDIAADDLIVLGIVDHVIRPYIVQSIQPQADMVAQLSLCVYDPALYDADIGALPTWSPAWGDDLINATALAVTSVTLTNRVVYIDRRPFQEVVIDFTVNSPFYGYAEIWFNVPNQRPQLVQRTETLQGIHSFSLIASQEMNMSELSYTVTPFTDAGLQGQSMTASTVPLTNPPPGAPPDFDLDVKRETITLIWSHPADEDVIAYEVWYDPRFTDATIASATRLTPSIPWPARTFEVPLRLGTYFIRSIDAAGQRSNDYAVAFTPTNTLWNLNVIETWDDEPDGWPGLKSNFAVTGSGDDLVTLPFSDGTFPQRAEYYYKETFDGGEIYQTRFTSKIFGAAYNANSYMASWTPLAIATPIAGWELDGSGLPVSIAGKVDIWHEIRWIDTEGAMIEWIPLEVAQPIGWGRSDVGIWRHFQVGEYIGRLFQFRLVAEYIGGAVPPDAGAFIESAQIEIDMPDRMDGDYNVTAPAGGLTITYDPPFRARPILSITPDLSASGERYAITLANEEGFRIEFFNAAGTSIARNFDWLVKGYGARATHVVTGLTLPKQYF